MTDPMREELLRLQQQASKHTRPEQAAISHGDAWLMTLPDGTLVFGRVLDSEAELPAYAGESPIGQQIDALRRDPAAYAHGWRVSEWHTYVTPDPVPSAFHVAALWPIKPNEFEHARLCAWHPTWDDWWFNRMMKRIAMEYRGRDRQDDAQFRIVED